ncbi:MAG: phenylalanine--tRNA ligase subunit beta [Chlamydiia bacterium]|nr:phenylalanine--tRNA ligase subunit beta [Chlamydiia bacterium]
MKVSLSWLKDFIDINDSPSRIAKILTELGIEVDAIEKQDPGFSKVVVAEVKAVSPHPDADKLVVAEVFDGDTTHQVVCGAPNCRAGLKTAYAQIGAQITPPGEKAFKIKKTKLRGVESNGMLCSGFELGISNEHEGILDFADRLKVGTDLSDLYSDIVFELSLTPNLGHASAIIGIARELSAATGEKLKWPQENAFVTKSEAVPYQVKVEDLKGAPRYAARLLTGLKIAPSPDWLKQRIESAGLRSVNNVVDVTNYVLLELGQPLHPFDFEKVEDKNVIIRRAKKGETLKTLDGKERKLSEDELVIADPKKVLALAGIMGGENSEVSETTTQVLLESAYFDPSVIRKGVKNQQLFSDAAKRFEKGADPNNVLTALDRAAFLIQQVAGGDIVGEAVDIASQSFEDKKITCRLSRVNNLLGTHFSVNELMTFFSRLGFGSEFDGADALTVTVPTYRGDISQEIDLVEEAARLYGYENFELESPKFKATTMPHAPVYLFEKEIKRRLVAEGLQEFVNCDLIGPTLLKAATGSEKPAENALKVLNPVSVEQSSLRTSLFPGLLAVVKHNFDRECPDIAGFEVGRVHFEEGEGVREETVVGIILSGHATPNLYDPKPRPFDFKDLKGVVENLLKGLKITQFTVRPSKLESLHPNKQAAIFVGGLEIGSFGEAHPAVQRRLDVPQKIYFAELNLADLFRVQKKDIKMEELPQYPSSTRDWTVTLLENAPVSQVTESILSFPSRLLESVELMDIYRSEKLGSDKKNATFRFIYRDRNKTLEQETCDKEHERLVESTLKLITGCLPPE